MEKMGQRRMEEIALVVLKYRMSKEGIRLTPDIQRELGNVSKATGIPSDQLKCFLKLLVEELLEEAFDKKK